MITKKEAETLIGGAIDKPDGEVKEYKSTKSWVSDCYYYCSKKKTNVGISIMPLGGKARGKKAFARYQQELQEGLGIKFKLTPINRIDDAAGWDKDMKQLTIFKGPFRIIITVISPKLKAPAALQLSKKFAAKVVTRIKY